jgi:hypothetical protein
MRIGSWVVLLGLWGCPGSDAPVPTDAGLVATHSGLISIQDVAVVGSSAGHALTVQATFNAVRRPDYEEKPGQPDGCKGWSYDLTRERVPAPEDHGWLSITGLKERDLRCAFDSGRGYACPGTGPVVGSPFLPAVPVRVELEPGKAFVLAPVEIVPGTAFELQAASQQAIVALPFAEPALTLDCASCGEAAVTIVRVTTTDAPIEGLGPTEMPAPQKRYVELSCANVAGTAVTIPGPALDLLRRAHAAAPLTRIRTAYMRDGLAQLVSAPPGPPNRAIVAVGHGMLGFTDMPTPAAAR